MIKITCSILCYNYGRFLAQAIESCLNQQPGDYELEILVIDDGSTDETPEVCARYADRVRILRSKNQGFGASLTKGITEATGDYVCYLDADDYFLPEKMNALLPATRDGQLYIEHAKYIIDEKGNRLEAQAQPGGNTSTLALRRDAALTLLPVENEIYFHPLKSAGSGIMLPEPLACYRIHPKSMVNHRPLHEWHTHHAGIARALAAHLRTLDPAKCFWAKDAAHLQRISSEYEATAHIDEMEAALGRGEWGRALSACLAAHRSTLAAGIPPNILLLKLTGRCLLRRPMRERQFA